MVAAFVLMRPRQGRLATLVVAGSLLAGALFYVLPTSVSKWHEGERKTAVRLVGTAAPGSIGGCGWAGHTLGGDAVIREADGLDHLWQIVTVREETDSDPSTSAKCTGLVIYDGWRHVKSIQLPAGFDIAEYSNSIAVFQGRTTKDTAVVIATVERGIRGFRLDNPEKMWAIPGPLAINCPPERIRQHGCSNGESPEIGVTKNTYVLMRNIGRHDAYVQAINPLNGNKLWRARCPRPYATMDSLGSSQEANRVYTGMYCRLSLRTLAVSISDKGKVSKQAEY